MEDKKSTLTLEDLRPDRITDALRGYGSNYNHQFESGTARWLIENEPDHLFRISTKPLTYAHPEDLSIFTIYWRVPNSYGGEPSRDFETSSVYPNLGFKRYIKECGMWFWERDLISSHERSRIEQLYFYLNNIKYNAKGFYGESIEEETLWHHLTRVSPRSNPVPLSLMDCFRPYFHVTIGELVNEELIKGLV